MPHSILITPTTLLIIKQPSSTTKSFQIQFKPFMNFTSTLP